MKFLYIIGTRLYYFLIKFFALWNLKARQWSQGRKNIFYFIQNQLGGGTKPIIWIHASSAGEIEQGRPLMKALKSIYPRYTILLTVFSPSGFKKIPEADFVFYLPADTASNARKWIAMIQPKLVFFIKYEFWYFYLREIKKHHIPLFLVSGIFRKEQIFFKPYTAFFRQLLHPFTHFFVQDDISQKLLHSIHLSNVYVTGDTRFDRVCEIVQQEKKDFSIITNLFAQNKIIVAGSTWTKDHELLSQLALAMPDIRFIIVPHEVDKVHIQETLTYFPKALLYSQLQQNNLPHTQILIVDSIGILSQLYQLAHITYVGGGFTPTGIHNVLEAAIYGKPVIWGPRYKKYLEAIGLIACGGGFSVATFPALQDIVQRLITDTSYYRETGNKAYNFVHHNQGATKKILQYLTDNNIGNVCGGVGLGNDILLSK